MFFCALILTQGAEGMCKGFTKHKTVANLFSVSYKAAPTAPE
jgi:hypothetical protein